MWTRFVGDKTFAAALLGICILWSGTAAQGGKLTQIEPLNTYAYIDDEFNNEIDPRVAGDGAGNYLAVWRPKPIYVENSHLDVASSVGGLHWMPGTATPSVERAQSGYYMLQDHDLCYSDGKWVVVWTLKTNLIVPKETYKSTRVYISVSSDMGQTWSAPTVIGSASGDWAPEGDVQLVAGDAGNILAVWNTINAETQDRQLNVCGSADSGISWSTPTQVHLVAPQKYVVARAAFAGDGKWLLVYSKGTTASDDKQIAVARSEDLGATWTDLGVLYPAVIEVEFRNFDIESAGGQTVVAVVGPDVRSIATTQPWSTIVYTSSDAGETFSAPLDLTGPVQGERLLRADVDLAADAAGNWVLGFRPHKAGPLYSPMEIWRSNDPDSNWSRVLNLGNPVFQNPRIVSGGNGEFLTVSQMYPAPPDLLKNDFDIAAMLSNDGGAQWSAPTYVNPDAATDCGVISDTDVDMKAGDETVLACWDSVSSHAFDAYYHLVANRQVMLRRSFNNGISWQPVRPLPGAHGTEPQLEYLGGRNWKCYFETPDGLFSCTSTNNGTTWFTPEPELARPTEPAVDEAANEAGTRVRVSTEVESHTSYYSLKTYSELSTDGGATWQSKTLLKTSTNDAYNYLSEFRGEPEIIYLGDGRFVALIKNLYYGTDYYNAGTIFLQFGRMELELVESADNGQTWSTPAPVVDLRYPNTPESTRTSFIGSHGRTIIAWGSDINYHGIRALGEDDIYYRGKTFGSETAARDWALYE